MFARSSKRALSSTRQTACLPRSVGADQRRDERRVVARAVHGLLDREHLGVGDGLLDEALHRGRERVVRMVEQDVALAHRGHHVGLLVTALALRARHRFARRLQARLGDRGPRLVAQVGETRHVHHVPEVVEVEQPLDLEQLALLDLQRVHQRLAQAPAHAGADLDPDDLAEAPPAQLLLDRPQQVVGVVVDGEVGVARDPEDVDVDDLHAREERVEVPGDQTLERHERAPVADRDEARQHLLGNLHAREGLLPGLRVAHEHGEREREVGDVGEGAAEADGERRQDREDLAPEALGELLAVARIDLVAGLDPDPVLGQRGPQDAVEDGGLAPRLLAHLGTDRGDRLRGAAAVLARPVDAAVDVLLQAGDAHHEELVEVARVDRAELEPLEQRDRLVLGELEHAVVELQPRELAVEVQRVVVEVGLGDSGRCGLLQIRQGASDANAARHRERRRVLPPRTRAARGSPCARTRPRARGSGRRAAAGARAGATAAPRCRRDPARAAPA